MAPLISAKNIVMTFSIRKGLKRIYFNAVDNVSIDVNEGEVVGLIGESGSGKTTLGKITLDLLKPTKGEVLYQGINIRKMNKQQYKKYRINAQYIPQDPYASLNPYRRVIDLLLDIVKYHKLVPTDKEALEMVKDVMARVGLTPPERYLDKYPFQLSGGERQRLSIAKAIVLNPRYIVADEPVTMLDASLKAGVMKTLKNNVKDIGASLLFITHEITLLQFFGPQTRVYVMYLGEILEHGRLNDLITKPLHPYTKALLDAIPLPDPTMRESRKVSITGQIPSPINKPSGCPLHPRCPYAKPICRTEKPQLKNIEKDHFVACHLY
ncbi:MAG: ABC transporter ATP-binding protein [Ignisphaera sp.]